MCPTFPAPQELEIIVSQLSSTDSSTPQHLAAGVGTAADEVATTGLLHRALSNYEMDALRVQLLESPRMNMAHLERRLEVYIDTHATVGPVWSDVRDMLERFVDEYEVSGLCFETPSPSTENLDALSEVGTI